MSLNYLINRSGARVDQVGAYLDNLNHHHRVHEVRGLCKQTQNRLWNLAAKSVPLSLEHFVPRRVGDLTEVVHHGHSTLPVFHDFQRRFCRPMKGSGRLFGYNESLLRYLVGPGFFVAQPTTGQGDWERRGAIVIDYSRPPDDAVVANWPEVVPSSSGKQRFLYGGTRDFLRRVSEHVSIAATYRGDRPVGVLATLCREP